MAMALGQGKVEVTGQITHYARYIDWSVTTLLLLLSLSWIAMHFIARDWTLIVSLMGTQAIIVVTGLIADLSTTDEARFLWYIYGLVAFLVVLWGIWGFLRAKPRGQGVDLSKLYNRLPNYFTVL